MKKFFLTLLCLSSLSLISCEKSNEEKAKEAIYTYLNENLDDMSAYEPVKFGTLDSIHQTNNPLTSHWKFQLFHSFRTMGDDGHPILNKEYFILNSQLEVITYNYYDIISHLKKYNTISVGPDSVAVDTAAAVPVDTISR